MAQGRERRHRIPRATAPTVAIRAIPARRRRSSSSSISGSLLDHVVCTSEQDGRNGNAQRLRCLEINDQLELRCSTLYRDGVRPCRSCVIVGYRTAREIETERIAPKALRGDFIGPTLNAIVSRATPFKQPACRIGRAIWLAASSRSGREGHCKMRDRSPRVS